MPKQDSMSRDIRKSLRAAFSRVPKYAVGTGKLFLASTRELINVEMPYIEGFYNINQDLLKDAVKVLRNPADAINKQVNRALSSESFKELQKFAKYALDDLKSGELYDSSRMRSVGGSVEDNLSEFGGFDMTGFDDEGNWDESSFDTAEIDADVKIAETQESNANERTRMTIDAIGTSTNAIVNTENANAQLALRSSMRQHGQIMNGFQNMITAQTATFELINKSINAQVDVTREAHQQVMSKMDEVTTLLGEIRDGVSPPQDTKARKEEATVFGHRGELNISEYIKHVIQNIDEKFQIKNTMAIGGGGRGLGDLIRTVSDNPWQLVTDQIVSHMVSPELRTQMERTNQNLGSFFPALLQKIHAKGEKFKNGEGGTGALLASLFGISPRSKSSIDISYRDPIKATQITLKTTRAIEEVIPMWLSKIHSALTGEPLQIYNYSTGKLERVRDVIATTTRNARDLAGRMGDTNYMVTKRIDKYTFKNTGEQTKFEDFIYQFLQYTAENNIFVRSDMSPADFRKIYEDIRGSSADSAERDRYYALTTGILKAIPDTARLGISKDIQTARADRHTSNERINNSLRDSGLVAAFSGFIPDKERSAIENITMTSARTKVGEDLDKSVIEKTKTAIGKTNAIAATGPLATNQLLDGILSSLRKGIITYTYILGNINGDEESPINDIVKSVRNTADVQHDLDTKVAKSISDAKTRAKDLKAKQEAEFEEKLKNASVDVTRSLVTSDITPEIAEIIQHQANIDNSQPGKSENKGSEEHRKWFTRQKEKLTGAMDDIAAQTGAKDLMKTLRELSQTPFKLFDDALKLTDAFLFKAIFGEDAASGLENNGESHLLSVLTKSLNLHFKNAANWFKENIGDPVKKLLFDRNDGIFGRLTKAVSDLVGWDDKKQKIKSAASRVSEKFIGKKVTETDEYGRTTTRYEGGKFSTPINRLNGQIGKLKSGTTAGVDDIVTKILYGNYGATKGVGRHMDLDENDNIIAKDTWAEYGGIIGSIKKSMHDFKEFMLGPDDKDTDSKQKWNAVKEEIGKAYPNVIIGSGLGFLASFFLPGGPVLGTLLGSTAGMVSGSDRLKEFLFGKFGEAEEAVRDRDGNLVIDRKTGRPKMRKIQTKAGLLDRDIVDGLKKFAPGIGIGGLLGGIAGGMGLLPFGLTSAAGTVIGGVTGMLASSDQVKELIFGKFGDDDSGLISKNDRKKVVDAVKKYAPPTLGLGVAGGALGSLLGAGLGLIPGLSLLPTGPIFGIMGALMGFANADRITKFFFGEENEREVTEDDGKGNKRTKKIKVREGGLFGGIHDFVRDKVTTPLGKKFNETGAKVQDWFHEAIVGPLKRSMQPFKDQMQKAGESIFNSLKNIGNRITESIFKVFNISINGEDGEHGLKWFFKEKVLKRLENLTNKMFDTIGKILGKIIAAPFKAFEAIVTGRLGSDDLDRDDRRQRRNAKRDEMRNSQREGMFGRAKKAFSRAGSHITDFITGRRKDRSTDTDSETSSANRGTKSDLERAGGRNRSTDQLPSWVDPKNEHAVKAYNQWKNSTGGTDNEAEYQQYWREQRIQSKLNRQRDKAAGVDRSVPSGEARDKDRRDRSRSESNTPKDKEPKRKGRDDVGSGKDERVTRESTTKLKLRGKTNNEYLRDIARHTRSMALEMKGQINGVGWNTAYIRTLLTKQYGGLSSDELPEEMEGSTRQIRKRRTIFGRIKDKVTDVAGGIKDKASEVVEKVVNVVTHPFRLLGNAAHAAKDAVTGFAGGLWSALKETGKVLWEGFKVAGSIAKEVLVGAAEGIGSVLAGVGDLFRGAARGIGEVLGDIAGTLTGVIHDATLAISSTVLGMVQMLTAIAPDIGITLWNALKGIGGGILKGTKFMLGGIGHGIKGAASWISNKVTRKKQTADSKPSETILKHIFDGGKLDSLGKIESAVPVYITGSIFHDDPNAQSVRPGNVPNIGSTSTVNNGNTSGPAPAGGESNTRNSTPESNASGSGDVDGIPGDQPNGNQSGSDDWYDWKHRSPSITERFRKWKRKYLATDRAAENSDNPGEEYDQEVRDAQSPDEVDAVRASQQMNSGNPGDWYNWKHEDDEEKKGGLLSALMGLLGGKGILGKLKGIGSALAASPVGAAIGSVVGKSILPAASTLGSMAATGYQLFGEQGNRLWGARNLVLNAKAVGQGISGIGKAVVGSADDMARLDPVRKAIAKVVKALTTNGVVVKMFGALKGKLGQVAQKLTTTLCGQVLQRAMKSGAVSAVKNGIKQIAAFASCGLGQIAFSVADFIAGFGNAKKYFNVFGSDVNLAMRLTSAIVNTLGGLLNLIPVAGPFLSVAVALVQDNIVQMIYGILADDDAKEELAENQKKLQAATDAYNEQNGTNLTVDEYSKKFNADGSKRGIGNTIKEGLASAGGMLKKAGGAIVGGAKKVGGFIMNVAEKAPEAISNAASWLGNFFANVGTQISEVIPKIPGAITDALGKIFGTLGDILKSPEHVGDILGKGIGAVLKGIGGIAGFTAKLGGALIGGLVKIGGGVLNLVGGLAKGLGTTILSGLKLVFTKGPGVIISLFKGLGGGIVDAIVSSVGGVAGFVKSFFGGIADGISSALTSTFGGISDGLSSIFGFKRSTPEEQAEKEARVAESYAHPYGNGPGKAANMESWGKGKSVTPMSQSDAKWNKSDRSMALTGCGPTAAAMVASAYGDRNANPSEANRMSYQTGMRAPDGGTNPDFFGKYAAAHGYGMREGVADSNAITKNLGKGQPVVVMGEGGPYGKNMHYMVADRTSGKNGVGLVDPLTGSRKSTSMNRLLNNTKTAVYSYGKGPFGRQAARDITSLRNLVPGMAGDQIGNRLNQNSDYDLNGNIHSAVSVGSGIYKAVRGATDTVSHFGRSSDILSRSLVGGFYTAKAALSGSAVADDIITGTPKIVRTLVTKLFGNTAVRNLFGSLSTKISPIISAVSDFIQTKVLPRVAQCSTSASFKTFLHRFGSFVTGGGLDVALAIKDFVSAFNSPERFFESGETPTLKMRLIAGVVNAIGTLMNLIPYIGPAASIAFSLVESELITRIYEILGEDSSDKGTSTTKDTIKTKFKYSKFGKGPGAEDSGDVSTAEAQQSLVNKMMWLKDHPINYSLDPNKQNPDKGSSSCANTVGWVYNKTLGITGMSGSSGEQSSDSRFTDIVRLGKPGKAPGKTFDLSLLQPGDIVYMKNPGSNHTEMYVGGGKTLSHGGPSWKDVGPTFRNLDETRQKRVFAVRRYTPFTNDSTVKLVDGAASTEGSSTTGDTTSSGTAAAAASTAGGLASLFKPDSDKGFTMSGLLNAFLGMGSAMTGGLNNALGGVLGQNDGTEDSEAAAETGDGSSSELGEFNGKAYTATESATKIWKFLRSQGLSKYAAAGVMGCWSEESNNRADRVEGDYLKKFPGFSTVMSGNTALDDYTKNILFPAYAKSGISLNKKGYLGDDGHYYPGVGLAQWTGPRGYNLFKYSKDQGKDWRDLDTQLAFFLSEIESRGLKETLNTAKNPTDAAHKVLDGYEMYAGFGAANPSFLTPRQTAASSIYKTYGNQPETQERGNRPSTQEVEAGGESWGKGPGGASLNLEMLNNTIRQMSSMFSSIQDDAREGSTVSQVTNHLVDSIKSIGVQPADNSAVERMVQVMAQSFATMIDLLSAIKDNTAVKKDVEQMDRIQPKRRSSYQDQEFDDMSAGTNTRDIGANLVDILTSK